MIQKKVIPAISVFLTTIAVIVLSQEANETDTLEGCVTSRTGEAVFKVSGIPGPPGPQGPSGPKGETGEKGLSGEKGEVGSKGERGDQGEGLPGAIGMKGEMGNKGDVGPPGLRGPIGIPGLAGVPGPRGASGRNGDEGPPGPEGPIGITGASGLPGPPGEAGAPGTAELSSADYNRIIANLTNTLTQKTECRSSCVPKSCQEILLSNPLASTDYYFISGGPYQPAHRVYCVVDQPLCGETGGWMQVAYINMADSSQKCPTQLVEHRRSNTAQRACGKPVSNGHFEITLPSLNVSYTKVCGRVKGYQVGSPDAFSGRGDGIYITQGQQKLHLWAYIAGWSETQSSHLSCPCAGIGFSGTVPIANNYYFCESGSDRGVSPSNNNHVFWDDPLWDGRNCPRGNTCCNNYGWFARSLTTSSDNLNLQWQLDERKANEDIYLDLVEIYIK